MRSRLLWLIGLAIVLSSLTLGPLATTARAQDVLSTELSGEEEVPGPGDPRGSGHATVTVNPDAGTICYVLSVTNLTARPTAAHIHVAPAGYSGPVVVRLTPPPAATGTSSGCARLADVPGATVPADLAGLAAAISDHPDAFYVNVHTPAFPLGAVRGQLGDDDED